MSKAWMPLYIGDYLADTAHLNQGQHGAYLLLIMHYWQRETLPSDPEQCYCIAHAMDKQSRCNVDAVLMQFFDKVGERYHHSRVDDELTHARKAYERRASAANSRWKKEKEKIPTGCNADAMHMQSQSQSYKPSPSREETGLDSIHPLQCAHRIIEVLSLPATQANMRAIEAAITAECQFTGTQAVEAAQAIADYAMKARKSGVAIDKFWFEDTKWRNVNGSGQSKISAGEARADHNKRAILDGFAANARNRDVSDDS